MVLEHVVIIAVMAGDGVAQESKCQGAERKDESIKRDRAGIAVIVAHVGGNEGDERHPEEKVVVGPEEAGVGVTGGVNEVVMVHPHDGDDDETEKIAEELWEKLIERSQSGVAGKFQLQHHDGDDDGDDAVGEGFEAVGAHAGILD